MTAAAPDYFASGCVICILWCRCFQLGLLAVCYPCYCACPWPLCSKTYSALVWSLMLVLLIGCYPYCCCTMPTLLQDIFCLGVVTYAGATDWVLLVLLLHHAHFAPRCIACPGVLLGQCCCCSYPVLI